MGLELSEGLSLSYVSIPCEHAGFSRTIGAAQREISLQINDESPIHQNLDESDHLYRFNCITDQIKDSNQSVI